MASANFILLALQVIAAAVIVHSRVRPDSSGLIAYSYSPLGLPFRIPVRDPFLGYEGDQEAASSSVVFSKLRPEGDLAPDASSRRNSLPFSKKPASLEGWLNKPTEAPVEAKISPKAVQEEKFGYCKTTEAYGIKCGREMSQCLSDQDCPGQTKCCAVSDCGRLCVMPSEEIPEKRRQTLKTKETTVESATTAEGLKMEDIAILPS